MASCGMRAECLNMLRDLRRVQRLAAGRGSHEGHNCHLSASLTVYFFYTILGVFEVEIAIRFLLWTRGGYDLHGSWNRSTI